MHAPTRCLASRAQRAGWDGRASLALSLDRVKIRYGPWSELLIAPENPDAFYADMAAHAPHLTRRGPDLVR